MAGLVGNKNVIIVVSAAVALGVIGILYFGGGLEVPGTVEKASVLATVNGEEVTQNDVDAIRQYLAPQGQPISDQDAVELAIDQKVLAQEARKQGYSPTRQETEEILEDELSRQGSTIEDLEVQARSQGSSYEEVLKGYQSQIAVQQYIEATVTVPEVNVSEAREVYERNKEQFATGGQVPSYEELEKSITAFLEVQKEQQAVSDLIQRLRAQASIVYS